VELLEKIKTNKPDVVLLDIEMPVMDGFKAHAELQKKYPEIKVIIISMHFEDAFVSHFFLNGANGYLPKDCKPEQLLDAIDAVMQEDYYLNESISKIILSSMIQEKKGNALLEKIELNDAQKEILKMICDEKSYKQIAAKLDISVHTVDYHRRTILSKTKQSSVIGLVKYAIRNGIANAE